MVVTVSGSLIYRLYMYIIYTLEGQTQVNVGFLQYSAFKYGSIYTCIHVPV